MRPVRLLARRRVHPSWLQMMGINFQRHQSHETKVLYLVERRSQEAKEATAGRRQVSLLPT